MSVKKINEVSAEVKAFVDNNKKNPSTGLPKGAILNSVTHCLYTNIGKLPNRRGAI